MSPASITRMAAFVPFTGGQTRPVAARPTTDRPVPGDQRARLRQAFGDYERALQEGERVDVVRARLALCTALADTGWEPPVEVADQVWRDRRTLRELEVEQRSAPSEELRPPSHRPPDSLHPLRV